MFTRNIKSINFSQLDSFIIICLLISVVQAIVGNLTNVNAFYFIPLILVFYTMFHFQLLLKDMSLIAIFNIFALLIFLVISFFSNFELDKEFSYQLYFFSCYFLVSILSRGLQFNPDDVKLLLLGWSVFSLFSLIIHFFMWEEVAVLFYFKENEFGGLLMDGTYKRLYSVLLNPLSTAFVSVYLLALLMILNYKNFFLLCFITLIGVLALSRTSLICMAMLWGLFLFSGKYYKTLYIVTFSLLLFLGVNDSLQMIIVNTFTGNDTTGSAVEHYSNLAIGAEYIFTMTGNGFVNAQDYGGWNIRLESTPLQFAFTGGFFPFMSVVIIVFLSTFKILKQFGLISALMYLTTLPILIFFPLHTFSFPVVVFFLLSNCWLFKKFLYQNVKITKAAKNQYAV